jgi:hypothetical protein
MDTTTCPRTIQTDACAFCGSEPGEACPLDEAPPFSGPPIGAVCKPGTADNPEECESMPMTDTTGDRPLLG